MHQLERIRRTYEHDGGRARLYELIGKSYLKGKNISCKKNMPKS